MVRILTTAVTSIAAALALAAAGQPASAQLGIARIWNVALGTPVADLPEAFMIQACGTNGGPPTVSIRGFEEFARCPKEPATGLREVWFSYDDEAEYYHRAMRAPAIIQESYRTNSLFEQLVIFSLLIDDNGLVQGHRIISDPREKPEMRIMADAIAMPLRTAAYGAFGWTCTDLPRREGEEPLAGVFTKELCEKVADGRRITMEIHHFLKSGQQVGRPGAPGANEFEVSVRVEMINADLVP